MSLLDYYTVVIRYTSVEHENNLYERIYNNSTFWDITSNLADNSVLIEGLIFFLHTFGVFLYLPVLYCFARYKKSLFDTPHYTLSMLMGFVDLILLR